MQPLCIEVVLSASTIEQCLAYQCVNLSSLIQPVDCISTIPSCARVARLNDGFFIKREFKYVSAVCVVGIAVWNGLAYVEVGYTGA